MLAASSNGTGTAAAAGSLALVVEASCAAVGAQSIGQPRSRAPAAVFAGVAATDIDFEDLAEGFDPTPAADGSALCEDGAVSAEMSAHDAFFTPVACAGAFDLGERDGRGASPPEPTNWLLGWSILDEKWRITSPLPWWLPSPEVPPPLPPPTSDAGPSASRQIVLFAVMGTIIGLPVLLFAGLLLAYPPSNVVYDRPPYRANTRRSLACRRLSKPFYRWAFVQGRRFTEESIAYFTCVARSLDPATRLSCAVLGSAPFFIAPSPSSKVPLTNPATPQVQVPNQVCYQAAEAAAGHAHATGRDQESRGHAGSGTARRCVR